MCLDDFMIGVESRLESGSDLALRRNRRQVNWMGCKPGDNGRHQANSAQAAKNYGSDLSDHLPSLEVDHDPFCG